MLKTSLPTNFYHSIYRWPKLTDTALHFCLQQMN